MKTLIGSAQLDLLGSAYAYPYEEDSIEVRRMVNDAIRAQHFYLPENCDLVGDPDHTYSMKGLPVRLPFKIITTSVTVSGVDFVTVAQESTRLLDGYSKSCRVIECRSAIRTDRYWSVNPILGIINTESASRGDAESISLAPFLRDALDLPDGIIKSLIPCVQASASQVFNLLAALACENVVFESEGVSDPAKAARSLSKNREPKYATKTLKILTPVPRVVKIGTDLVANESDESVLEDDEYCRASPKQHLRRGHIRTLPSGKRIWVNECVVSDSANGILTKRYAISSDPSAFIPNI